MYDFGYRFTGGLDQFSTGRLYMRLISTTTSLGLFRSLPVTMALIAMAPGCGVDADGDDEIPTATTAQDVSALCQQHPYIIVRTPHEDWTGVALCEPGYTRIRYNGAVHDFIVGTNTAVYHSWWNFDTNTGIPWESLGGSVDAGGADAGIKAGVVSGGALRLCANAATSPNWYRNNYFGGWSGWVNAGPAGSGCVAQSQPQPFTGPGD